MKPYWTDKVVALGFLVLLAVASGCKGVRSEPPDAQDQSASLPFSETDGIGLAKGTPIYVRLQHPISSSTAEPGQSFSAVLDAPLMVNGRIVAPEGGTVSVRVLAVRQSGRLRDFGYLRVTLSSLAINGKEFPIQASSVFVEGGAYKKRGLAFVGGAAGGKRLMGALSAGAAGALSGSSLSPSEGSTAAFISNNQEVGLAAERRIGFFLIEPLRIG